MPTGNVRARPAVRTWLTLSTCFVIGLLGVIYAYGVHLIGR